MPGADGQRRLEPQQPVGPSRPHNHGTGWSDGSGALGEVTFVVFRMFSRHDSKHEHQSLSSKVRQHIKNNHLLIVKIIIIHILAINIIANINMIIFCFCMVYFIFNSIFYILFYLFTWFFFKKNTAAP